MNDDKIAEIRARHQRIETTDDAILVYFEFSWANADRGWLLAEVERQARHIEELREKIDAERSCACSFDGAGDVCAVHSPALMDARAEVERLRAEKEDLYASIAGIERAAAGAIYSQESIHAMALYALKPLMERGIEALEAKP